MRVKKERKETELKADISLLNHRLEGLQKQLSIQKSELSTLERRLEVKNQLAIDLEEKTTNMKKRVSELQDGVLSWKLSSVEKIKMQVSELCLEQKKNQVVKIRTLMKVSQKLALRHLINLQVGAWKKKRRNSLAGSKRRVKPIENKNTPKSNKSTKSSQKKKVRVVGISNIKFISPAYLGGCEFSASKITRYTLKEIKDYFSRLNREEKQDVFVLQSLCNDIKTKSPEACADCIEDIGDTISSKYKDSKIIVSLGQPRSDSNINTKTEKTNILIKEKLAGQEHVTVCDNGNQFYRG